MIVAMLSLLFTLQQEPATAAGAGFDEASRIYQKVASSPVTGAASLQNRVDTVKKRIEDMQSQIERANAALVSLERQEMEHTLAIQSTFEGEERERRLVDLQQTLAPRRAGIEENRRILQSDLQSARQDLGQLQIDADLARAMQPKQGSAITASSSKAEERVRRYFRDKAQALGLPTLQHLDRYWVERDSVVR